MRSRSTAGLIAAAALAACCLGSCVSHRKLDAIRSSRATARIELPQQSTPQELHYSGPERDTVQVHDIEGQKMIVMKAVQDEDGSLIAHDEIKAAIVVARFRNIAERGGKVDLQFEVIVPQSMQDDNWQLRFYPHLELMGEQTELEPVIITGRQYRNAQLRGYQQYNRFLQRIVSDSTKFIDAKALDIFLMRNIPAVYAFKTDTSFVSDSLFESSFGVSSQEALSHYTNYLAVRINNYRKSIRGRMYKRYVKAPIETNGMRLDTVLTVSSGDFIYEYVQTISTRPQLRKACIWLDGQILEQNNLLYSIPATDTLTFYISSLSSFADQSEKYLTRVVERRATANSVCWIEFGAGRSDIEISRGNNASEIGRIKSNLTSLISSKDFIVDSILVSAFCSPEGSESVNNQLAARRSEAVCGHFRSFVQACRDSLSASEGPLFDEYGKPVRQEYPDIVFKPLCEGENWLGLDKLIEEDSLLTTAQKERYSHVCKTANLDKRESILASEPFYIHLRKELYPMLRTVKFNFAMHRKGMIKDTIHTTVLDSTYMLGVQALKERDYKAAIALLQPYKDFNLAVAYCALDYNASALEVLQKLPETAETDYLLALVYSRRGRERDAIEKYLRAIQLNKSLIYRGNLDPEISALIKHYQLTQEN